MSERDDDNGAHWINVVSYHSTEEFERLPGFPPVLILAVVWSVLVGTFVALFL